jgi:hypothetical protein
MGSLPKSHYGRFVHPGLPPFYGAEERLGTIFQYFAAPALFISCLGLFGMASDLAEQRTREISIRFNKFFTNSFHLHDNSGRPPDYLGTVKNTDQGGTKCQPRFKT